jgi:hypothetical protein
MRRNTHRPTRAPVREVLPAQAEVRRRLVGAKRLLLAEREDRAALTRVRGAHKQGNPGGLPEPE